ncbi:hypothetical protein NDU88_005914 [Pleurodeles waltl]|uniref:Uncharacterized protein n=1 Tax=Pleurodeles waltl TaxID=8319 RepID=A0AAV7TVM6_PLEWA|nr:hypothetical protein NDU88_005914 [Pleurodeles waltl]
MVRPWNRLTSRGTVRSSLHEILRSPEEIRRGVKDPHSARGPAEEPGRPKKCKPTETEVRSLSHLHRHPSPRSP